MRQHKRSSALDRGFGRAALAWKCVQHVQQIQQELQQLQQRCDHAEREASRQKLRAERAAGHGVQVEERRDTLLVCINLPIPIPMLDCT